MEFRERPAFRRGQSLRPHFRTAFVGAFLLTILLAACSYKRPIPTRTDPRGPAAHRGAAAETESIPDAEQHLHGWRTTEAAYEEAYGNSPHPMILHKLLTTQFLILMREAGEGIYGPLQVERLASLCSRGTTSFHKILCGSAQERLRQRRFFPSGQVHVSSSIWDREIPVENPLLAAYLRFLLTGRNQDSQPSGKNALETLDPDRTSPLTLYLAWKKERIGKTGVHAQRHPRFAELLLYRGSRLLEEARFADAIDSMTEAIRLVPEYTRAMVGLGDFHLRSLHLYDRALDYFEDALTWDPQDISALFGHGAALHLLGRYETSQGSLDRLLELEPTVWKAIPQESGRSFRGRTCYWKAKNHDATGSPEKARKWVDRAFSDLPRSEAALYLSGMLHLEKGELGLARSEFLKVVDGGTELCDAYYQLGVINQSRPGRDFLFNFMNNAYCRQRKLINLKEKLNGAKGMDLDSARKEEVVEVLRARRDRLREDTLASLFNMTKRASSIGELDATTFHQAMDEVWNRLSDPEW